MTAVTPTDRPKSVRNLCVIEVFDGVLFVVMLLFGFFCGCRGFCHKTESDLCLFLFSHKLKAQMQSRFTIALFDRLRGYKVMGELNLPYLPSCDLHPGIFPFRY